MKTDNLRLVESDGMPPQVALELLCEPKARLTNRQRKVCQQARDKVFVSTRQPKPLDEKLPEKLRSRTWEQLNRWLRRSIAKRADCQRAYLRLPEPNNSDPKSVAITNRIRAVLELRAAQLDVLRDSLSDEIARRVAQQKAFQKITL